MQKYHGSPSSSTAARFSRVITPASPMDGFLPAQLTWRLDQPLHTACFQGVASQVELTDLVRLSHSGGLQVRAQRVTDCRA